MSEVKTTSKNIIFYGPPGTGKTYNTVKRAVDIIDGNKGNEGKDYLNRYDELKKAGLIEFTTFHQSYGYEDFIEGIRPVMGDKDKASDLKYEIHDGVFKAFCNKKDVVRKDIVIRKDAKVWAVRPARQTQEKEHVKPCINNGYIQFGNDSKIKKTESFKTQMKIGDIVLLFTGYFPTDKHPNPDEPITMQAVGVITGMCQDMSKENKVYPYRRKVLWLDTDIKEENVCADSLKKLKSVLSTQVKSENPCISDETINADYIINTFNLSNKVNTGAEFKIMDKVLHKVFIIDEINRGNISKIFGELITLIEDTKRLGESDRHSVKLPYSNEDFGVPDNVYIIGTMNTADRSIAPLDTALRRRFDFEEMIPDSSLLNGVVIDGINIKEMLDKINERIEVLYDREHQIGHAYFMELKEEQSIGKLGSIFKYKIIPLLQEYFYEDYEKIRLILGDNKKEKQNPFIHKNNIGSDLFGESDIVDDDDLVKYSINEDAFLESSAYKKIYE